MKRELAKRHRDDRNTYTEAKSVFIRTALKGDGPDTSAQAIMERLGHEPATLAEFEVEFGAVKPADGEG